MEDFNLVLRELVKKPETSIEIPENLKKEFETTAQKYIEKDMFLEAIKAFALTKNESKLIELGNLCLTKNKPELSFKAFYFAKNKEGMSEAGMMFLNQEEPRKALECFKAADNQEMIEFVEKNF